MGRMNLARGASSAEVAAAVDESEILAAYNASTAGRRIECMRNWRQLNDFGRWKLQFVQRKFANAVSKELLTLRAAQKKVSVKYLVARQRSRDMEHPVLRRVTGKLAVKTWARKRRINRKRTKLVKTLKGRK